MSASSDPLVSIVVPAHNAETTIRETIDAALRQTFSNFELIVIDDGSTDATGAIVAGFTDPRVRYFSFENAGPSAARNRGIELSSGPFIAFLDADDLWLPSKLAAQLDVLSQNPSAALAYCWANSIDEAGAFLKTGNHVRPSVPVYEQLITCNFLDNGSTPMVRREALTEVGGFDETLWLAEDWDLWLRLANRYLLVCVPEALVLYRVRQSSCSSNVPRQVAASLNVIETALERLPPSRDRDRLERLAKAALYQYAAMRLIEAGADRHSGLEAAAYWWRYVVTTPNLVSQLNRIALNGGAILANLLLPPRQFKRLRQGWSRYRSAKSGQ